MSRACGGPQVGDVTRLGGGNPPVDHVYMIGGVTRHMFPSIWGPPPPCKLALPLPSQYQITFRTDMKKSRKTRVYHCMISKDNTELEQVVHAHLPKRVRDSKSQSSPLNVYFLLGGFQSSLLLMYFLYCPNTCSHFTEVWLRAYRICNDPILRSARRCFAPL